MGHQVKFVQTTQSQYDAIAIKESSTLYFTTDTKRIYKGSDLYAATEFDQLIADSIEVSEITVDGKNVSLEGHTHTTSDITDLPNLSNWESRLQSVESQLSGLEAQLHVINNGENA